MTKITNAPITYKNISADELISHLVDTMDYDRFSKDHVIFCLIEPKSSNQFTNKDTKFPIAVEISSAQMEYGFHHDKDLLSRLNSMGTGWIYSKPLILKKGDSILLFGEDLFFKDILFDGVNKKIIFEDHNKKSVDMNLNNSAFIQHLYNEVLSNTPEDKPKRGGFKR